MDPASWLAAKLLGAAAITVTGTGMTIFAIIGTSNTSFDCGGSSDWLIPDKDVVLFNKVTRGLCKEVKHATKFEPKENGR